MKMKINQELRSQLETAQKIPQQIPANKEKFNSLITSQSQKLQGQEMQKLLSDLTAQGEKLSRFRSFRDLARYKRMVKDFVQEAVNYGMDLKHSHSWNMEGNSRKLTIVEAVDQKLVELTEAVIEQEKKSIGVLDIIGEIKGLLVNLYT